MSELSARTIGFGEALAEQFRWFWHRQWLWIVIVTVLPALACVSAIASMPDEGRGLVSVFFGTAFHPLFVLIALSWALSAWRDDRPKDRQYFWLHPVERTTHTVARSLAAYLWLLIVLSLVIGAVVVATLVTMGGDAQLGGAQFWVYVLASVTLAYIAGSIASVLSDRPELWIVAVVALVIIAGVIANFRDIEWLKEFLTQVFQGGPRSFGTALGAPGIEAAKMLASMASPDATVELQGMENIRNAQPGIALLIWLPVATGAYLGAARASQPR